MPSARRQRVPLAAALSLLVALACAAPPTDAPPLPASGQHRVTASGGAADALVASGATVVADYGTFRVLDAAPAALRGVGSAPEVEIRNDFLRIELNSGPIDTSLPALAAASRAPAVGADGKALHLFQFAAPVQAEWLARLEASGVKLVTYVPANAYLLYGDEAALQRAHALALADKEVQFDAPYLPAHKIDRALATADSGSYAVQLVEDPGVNEATLALARSVGKRAGTVSHVLGYVNLVIHADRTAPDALAARPDVVSVQPWAEPKLMDERQDLIMSGQLTGTQPTAPGYLAWLASKGFTQEQFDASGFGVDVTDSGLDNGSTTPNHFGLYRLGTVNGTSRVSYVRFEGSPGNTLAGCDGHGTINAHIIGGYSDRAGSTFVDPQGYEYGLGVAPYVKLGGSVVFNTSGSFSSPDYEDLISRAYDAGMRISSNSWGANTSSYTSDCQRYDALVRDGQPDASAVPAAGNQQMVIVFAAGNAGSASGTIGSPGNAKNVISAGASENVRAFGAADGCAVADTSANAAFDVASFSSRGPAADGRTRPDLMAPGTHVTGGVAQANGQRAEPPASATGAALACYVGSGVCGGTSSAFFPSGQQWYTASSGTSHSTPAIAGAAALVRQWFLNQGLPAPSPAMTKAFLMNAARYMNGTGANDALFSNAQGMGLVDLGFAFDGTARVLRDQEDLFTATGQTYSYASAIGDPTKPFRVTLAWTDAPGSTAGSAWKNDLDLSVDLGGTVYKGNVFSGASSIPGGAADTKNNVESVFLPAGTTGTFTVTVRASNINSDGVPGNANPLDQDFALVIANGCATPPPSPPTGVTATATSDNVVTVSWTGAASSFLVYRATTPGGPYSSVAAVAAPPYVDTGRSGGLTYYYVVRAQQGCAVSPFSAEASATATGACLLAPAFAGLASASTTGGSACGNQLTWSAATPACGGTIAFDVFRSTTAGFTPGPANRIATGATATSYVDGGGILGGTTYYYVVRAVETSLGGSVTDGNNVQRAAAPYLVTQLLRDDFDANRPLNPGAWWIERATAGPDQLTLVSGCRWSSSNTAYRFGQASASCGGTYSNSTENVLVLGGNGTVSPSINGITLPAGAGARLTFRIWYQLEPTYDGGDLVYSTVGPTGPYTAISDTVTAGAPYIMSGGYDGTFYGIGSNRRGWTGSAMPPNGGLKEVVVNLDALAGQKIWFGWRVATDSSVVYEGLYLDDVLLQVNDPGCSSCAVPPPAAPAGVSAAATALNEVTVSWTANGSDSYDVLRSTTSGGPYALVGNVAAPPFVDGAVSGGATYHYVVKARQSCAVSAASTEATATATGACFLPPTFGGLASADTTRGSSCGNALSWLAATPSCGGTIAYDVFRSTTSGFVPAPASRIATGVTTTTYVDASGLASGTTYYYVVRAVETSGAGSAPDANTVQRSATPAFVVPLYRDDFDANRLPTPAAWWIEQALVGPDQLQIVTGCRWQSATSAYRFGQAAAACGGQYPTSTTSQLVLGGNGSTPGVNGIAIPGGGATLAFRLWYDLENGYDGAYLTYSTTGPTGTFTQVPDSVSASAPYIVQGIYDRTISSGPRAWSGQSGGGNGSFKQVLVNLDPVAGRTVWFGWRISSNSIVPAEGLYLDDVAIDGHPTTCSSTPAPPGAPVRFQISGAPASVTADAATAVTIVALDASGQIATDYPGPATLASSDPAAVLPASITFSSGMAAATVRLRSAGMRTVTVADATNAAIQGTASTTVVAGPPATLAFSVQPPTATAGVAFNPNVRVSVSDAFGNAASSGAVTLSLGQNPGGTTLLGGTSGVPSNGAVAFGTVYLTKAAAGYTLVASASGLPDATSQAFDVVPAAASALAFVQQPPTAIAGAAISPAPAVELRDVYGNPTGAGALVTVALATNPYGATLSGTTTVGATGGIATFDDLHMDKAGGGYALLATASLTSSELSADFAVDPAAPTHALVLQQPQSVRARVPFSPPLSAMLLDAYQNPTVAATTLMTVSLAANPGGASLVGTTDVAAAAGVVTFTDVAVDRPGSGYQLQIGAPGFTPVMTASFDVFPGSAARYGVAGPTTPAAGASESYDVSALDQNGDVAWDYTGLAYVTSSDPAAVFPATVSFAAGHAGPVAVTFNTGGTQTLTFTGSAPTLTGSFTVVVGGAPAPTPPPPAGDSAKGGCGCGSVGAESGAALFALAALLRRRKPRRA